MRKSTYKVFFFCAQTSVFFMSKIKRRLTMDENTKLLMDINQRLARVETSLESLTSISDVATDAKEIATSAHTSSRSAHKRIDKIDNTLFWLSTTVIGAVIVAVLTLAFKGVS